MIRIKMTNNTKTNRQQQQTPQDRSSTDYHVMNDDMARRNYFNKSQYQTNQSNNGQLDREIYVNSSYLKKLYSNQQQQEQANYPHKSSRREPDVYRDDASVLNTSRKRSNSLSSLQHQNQHHYYPQDFHIPPPPPQSAAAATSNRAGDVILPSPTSADYLRNRTRENALINVVMKPTRTPNDFEISQILYDDMAYRQLRKDAEAHKIAQIKAVNLLPPPSSPSTNIATLPPNAASPSNKTVKMIKQQRDSKQRASNSTMLPTNSPYNYQYIEQAAQRYYLKDRFIYNNSIECL